MYFTYQRWFNANFKKMKIFVFIFINLLFIIFGFSQNPAAIEYINLYKNIAIDEMKRTGIPASITLAQAILESGMGQSELARKSNNHFGIKCKTNWLGKKVYFDDDEANECFRQYNSVKESFIDHSEFISKGTRYQFLFKFNPLDDTAWAEGLQSAKYATNPLYAQRLLFIISEYKLHQYSIEALNLNASKKQINDSKDKPISNKDNEVSYVYPIHESIIANDNGTFKHDHSHIIKGEENELFFKIIKLNHKKAIIVPEGTALINVAENFKISLANIYRYNDLIDLDFTITDQVIFLEPKARKGSFKAIQITHPESIYQIAQEEGVRLKQLMKYNKVSKNKIFEAGAIIYLQKHKKK